APRSPPNDDPTSASTTPRKPPSPHCCPAAAMISSSTRRIRRRPTGTSSASVGRGPRAAAKLLGMKVRSVALEDATAIARVHVDSWRTTYTGLLPDEVIAAQTVESREASWRRQIAAVLEDPRRGVILVAEDDDLGVVGFTSAGPERERDADNDAELYTLYLLEQHQGRRVGRLLFEG